jgi:hypothetical protein
MGLQGDLSERTTRSASLRWLQGQLLWERRLSELRHAVSVVPADEVSAHRAPRQLEARSADHLSAAS